MNLLQLVTFNVKVLFLVFVSMWIRGTLPRVRIDQMMSLCWKYFVPISFIDMIGTAVWVAIWPDGNPVAAMDYLGARGGVADPVRSPRDVLFHTRRRMELYLQSDNLRARRLDGRGGQLLSQYQGSRHLDFRGMAVSASHFIRKPYTMQYPDRMRFACRIRCRSAIAASSKSTWRSAPDASLATAPVRSTASRLRDREGCTNPRNRHLAVRHRYRQMHVLRSLQRAVSDRLDPSHDRI